MKKICLFLVLLLIICTSGCDVKEDLVLECISDEIVFLPTSYMVMELPQNVLLTQSAEDGRISLFTHEDYEIIQEIFLAENHEAAIRHVSGQSPEPIRLPDGSSRFSWVSAQENGLITCSAVLLTDGEYYYCLSIRCPAEIEKYYRQEFSRILASVGIEQV